MNRKNKESRLIIFFIGTIFASGIFLFYIGITNISNYRELLKNRIAEEESLLTQQFADHFQKNIDSLILVLEVVKGQSKKELAEIEPAICEIVRLDRNGKYLQPQFVSSDYFYPLAESNKTFSFLLQKAENKEFRNNQLEKAENEYNKLFNYCRTEHDSVKVLNALTRLHLKMGNTEKMIKYASTIIQEHPSALNTTGYPYAYYSIMQILKNKDREFNGEKEDIIFDFLGALSLDSIPLNISTLDLLGSIEQWISQLSNTSRHDEFKKMISSLRQRLARIMAFEPVFENSILDGKNDLVNISGREIILAHPVDFGALQNVAILIEDQSFYRGIIIDLQFIYGEIINTLEYEKPGMNYVFTMVNKNESNYLEQSSFVKRSAFSNYFNQSLLEVSLKDEDRVDKAVFRRRIIYGIGLVLLFSFMVLGFYLFVKDVNREKKLNRMRSEFVSNVTHELKTPLTSINMFAEALNFERANLNEGQAKYVMIILKEGEKLKRMINNILDFSKKENASLSYKLSKTRLSSVVRSTLKDMDYFLEINGMQTEVLYEDDLYVMAHFEGMKQVLSNLISNAIKYSADHKKLIIRLYGKDEMAYIDVEDFGCGIEKNKLDHIFDKFYRVKSNENESISGTGLGLTVAKAIVEAQNGQILVESIPGKGSKFTIAFNAVDH